MIELFDLEFFLNYKEKFETDNLLQLSFTNIKKTEVVKIIEICDQHNLTFIIVKPYNGLITFNIVKLNNN